MFIKSGCFNDDKSNYKVKKGIKQFVYQPKKLVEIETTFKMLGTYTRRSIVMKYSLASATLSG
jgi:hypothetical protein